MKGSPTLSFYSPDIARNFTKYTLLPANPVVLGGVTLDPEELLDNHLNNEVEKLRSSMWIRRNGV
jgi:hypothetical protein